MRQRLPFVQAALTSFHRSAVGEIKVFQHLSQAPLPFRMPGKLLGRDSAYGVGNFIAQSLQMMIHTLSPKVRALRSGTFEELTLSRMKRDIKSRKILYSREGL
jgi:hypothetical protein